MLPDIEGAAVVVGDAARAKRRTLKRREAMAVESITGMSSSSSARERVV